MYVEIKAEKNFQTLRILTKYLRRKFYFNLHQANKKTMTRSKYKFYILETYFSSPSFYFIPFSCINYSNSKIKN